MFRPRYSKWPGFGDTQRHLSVARQGVIGIMFVLVLKSHIGIRLSLISLYAPLVVRTSSIAITAGQTEKSGILCLHEWGVVEKSGENV